MVRRNPRLACVDTDSRGRDFLTPIGVAHVLEMATLGCDISEIARYLRVGTPWLKSLVDPESPNFHEETADAFDDGSAAFQKRLREHQLALSETNAQMAIHLGKQYLGQHDRREVDINSRIQIVGTLPNYAQDFDDWQRMFSPSALQPQRMLEAEDVEVLATPLENGDEARGKDKNSNQ